MKILTRFFALFNKFSSIKIFLYQKKLLVLKIKINYYCYD